MSRIKTFSESVKPENIPGEEVQPPLEWPMKGRINIRGISASYEYDCRLVSWSYKNVNHSGRETETPQHLVFTDVDIGIAPGEKVAICGRPGR